MTVEIPKVPNFVRTSTGRVAVGEMTYAAILSLGKAWTRNLLANADKQRKEGLENFRPKAP